MIGFISGYLLGKLRGKRRKRRGWCKQVKLPPSDLPPPLTPQPKRKIRVET